MAESNYRVALKEAQFEFARLLAQKKTVEQRLIALSKTITTLRGLLNEKVTTEFAMRFTDACRYVLQGARTPKTPVEIRQDLDGIGFPVQEYKNILASIHTIMKRLLAKGEVELVKVNGEAAYIATGKLQPPTRALVVNW